MIAECSFLLSTFKYLALVLLNNPNIDAQQNPSMGGQNGVSVEEKRGQEFLGLLLVFVDIVFVVASSISVLALVWLLRKDAKLSFEKPEAEAKGKEKKKNTNKKKILPVVGSEGPVIHRPKSVGEKSRDPTKVAGRSGEETAVHFVEKTSASTTDKSPVKLATEEKQAGTLGTPGQRKEVKVQGKAKEVRGPTPCAEYHGLACETKTLNSGHEEAKEEADCANDKEGK